MIHASILVSHSNFHITFTVSRILLEIITWRDVWIQVFIIVLPSQMRLQCNIITTFNTWSRSHECGIITCTVYWEILRQVWMIQDFTSSSSFFTCSRAGSRSNRLIVIGVCANRVSFHLKFYGSRVVILNKYYVVVPKEEKQLW